MVYEWLYPSHHFPTGDSLSILNLDPFYNNRATIDGYMLTGDTTKAIPIAKPLRVWMRKCLCLHSHTQAHTHTLYMERVCRHTQTTNLILNKNEVNVQIKQLFHIHLNILSCAWFHWKSFIWIFVHHKFIDENKCVISMLTKSTNYCNENQIDIKTKRNKTNQWSRALFLFRATANIAHANLSK